MNVLITGISGFVGRRLALSLLMQGHKVFGFGFRRSIDDLLPFWGRHFDKISYREVDILDPIAVQDCVVWSNPHFIFHLAAIANIRTARANPYSVYLTNVLGTHSVLSAASHHGNPGVHLASSSDVYGPVSSKQQPISEGQPLHGHNPYAVSKIAMEGVGRVFWHSCPYVSVVVTRLFTTIGVGQYTDAAISYFAWQVARIKLGLQDPSLKCGNIDNHRSFLDIRDVIRAYTRLPDLQRGAEYEDTIYNITGGEEVSLRHIIECLFKLAGVSPEIARSCEETREVDITHQVGDGIRFEDAVGWKPSIPLMDTVSEMYEYWLAELER